MQVLRSMITELPGDLLVQARTLVCEAFSDPVDAYGCLDPTAVLLAVDEGKVVGHSFLYERAVVLGDRSLQLGMIGDVAVSAERRSEGLCKKLLQSAHAHFRQRSIDYSVLFAFEPPIYRSSGYVPMRNTTRFLDKDGTWKTLVHRGGMAAALGAMPWPHEPLDLKGRAV
jgi:predicted GNAT family N-acyltransferase